MKPQPSEAMNPQDQQKLERLVSQAVRNLPPRRAPSSLEMRVQAEIARRAALPWWRKSFVYWPLPARAVFVVVAAAFIKVALMVGVWISAGFDTTRFKAAFTPELQWAHAVTALVNVAGDFVHAVINSIPPLWLYGGAAIIAGFYIALFGLGAAAYRTLYSSR